MITEFKLLKGFNKETISFGGMDITLEPKYENQIQIDFRYVTDGVRRIGYCIKMTKPYSTYINDADNLLRYIYYDLYNTKDERVLEFNLKQVFFEK
jgi:hypothetical protein